MIQLIGKFLRIFFFGIVLLVLVSGGSNTDNDYTGLESGLYHFKFSGLVNHSSIGVASFQNIVEKDVLGENVNKLKLSFKSGCNSDIELIEFVISPKSIGANGISAGIYKIKNLEQLINRFNGVFGFADLGTFSELPFFVNKGSITVLKSEAGVVMGSLEVKFENTDEEALYIKGFFNAN